MLALKHLPMLTPAAESRLAGVGCVSEWQKIKDDIAARRAQLFFTQDDTYLVLRVDAHDSELVIVALTGKNGVAVMETVTHVAKQMGLRSVRFHTARRGLARLVKQFKPELIEKVYRVTV